MFPFTTHGFCPPIIMGDFNLKICWNFAGPHVFLKSFFLNSFSENLFFNFFINLYGESNILWLHFHYFIYLETPKHPEKWSLPFNNFFRICECIRSRYLPISPYTFSNYLKLLFNSSDQNPWKISVKKFSFREKYLETSCKCIYIGFSLEILKHLFSRTVTLVVSDSL